MLIYLINWRVRVFMMHCLCRFRLLDLSMDCCMSWAHTMPVVHTKASKWWCQWRSTKNRKNDSLWTNIKQTTTIKRIFFKNNIQHHKIKQNAINQLNLWAVLGYKLELHWTYISIWFHLNNFCLVQRAQ